MVSFHRQIRGRTGFRTAREEPQTLMAQLCLQDAVLFAQVQDDLLLFMLEPAEEGRNEELHRNHGAESTPIAGRGSRTTGIHKLVH
jgi:hypothetical protein